MNPSNEVLSAWKKYLNTKYRLKNVYCSPESVILHYETVQANDDCSKVRVGTTDCYYQ